MFERLSSSNDEYLTETARGARAFVLWRQRRYYGVVVRVFGSNILAPTIRGILLLLMQRWLD